MYLSYSLYEVFLIISLAIPGVLFSIFFILLFKWPQKIVPTNKKNGAIKIEDFVNPINKSITSVLKNNLYENSSLQKSLTDIHLLLEKMNSALIRFDEKKVENNNEMEVETITSVLKNNLYENSSLQKSLTDIHLLLEKMNSALIRFDEKKVENNNEMEVETITSVLKNNLYENSSLQKSLTDIHLLLEKMNSALIRFDEKKVENNNEMEVETITSVLKNNLYENSSLQKSLTDIHLLLEKMNSALIRFDEKKVENNNEMEVETITSVLKNNLYENSSLQKSLTDIHLLLEKMNSALIRFDEKKVENNNIDNNDRSVKTKSLSKSPSSFSSDVFSTVDLPKTKIEDTMIFKDKKDVHKNAKDIDEIVNSTYENNSIVELRSLEVEILNALKRLEKNNLDKNTEN